MVGEAASGQASLAAAGRAAAAGLRSGVESRAARGSETARAVADVGGAGPRQGRLGSYATRAVAGWRVAAAAGGPCAVGDRWIEGAHRLGGGDGDRHRSPEGEPLRVGEVIISYCVTWLLVFVLELQMQCNATGHYRCYFSRR